MYLCNTLTDTLKSHAFVVDLQHNIVSYAY